MQLTMAHNRVIVSGEFGEASFYSKGSEPGGKVRKSCTLTDTVNDMPAAEYETSLAQNGFACTLAQNNDFICWSKESGQGFQLRKHWARSL